MEIERREVEKMFYGGEEQRLTASAALLKLRYDTLLNSKCRVLKHFMNVSQNAQRP